MIKFEYQYDENSEKVVMELPSQSTISEVLESFERFLHAATYIFDGTVDIIPSEEAIYETEQEEGPEASIEG